MKLKFERGNPRQNGVTKPNDDTMTGRVWVLIERYRSANGGRLPSSDELWALYDADVEGANKVTMTTQFSRYVRYHNAYAAQAEMRGRRAEDAAEKRRAKRREQYRARKAGA